MQSLGEIEVRRVSAPSIKPAGGKANCINQLIPQTRSY